jgi:hypothetical protein
MLLSLLEMCSKRWCRKLKVKLQATKMARRKLKREEGEEHSYNKKKINNYSN